VSNGHRGPLVRRTMAAVVGFALTGGVLVAASSPASATTPDVKVVSSSSYGPESDGFLYIVGEVVNAGTEDAASIAVSIGLYDGMGKLLSTDSAPTQLAGLAPGEKGGFVDIVSPVAGYASYKIVGATATDSPVPPYHDFAVHGVSDVVGANGVHDLTGTVTNNGYYVATTVRAFFTFYNQAGTVVDVDSQPVTPAQIGIAASGTFTEQNIPAHIAYSRSAVVIEGVVPPPTCSPCVALNRIAGSDRVGTSVATSQDEFPGAHSAAAVVLARADAFPDALTGGPLAAHVGGPLLITASSTLDPRVATEIQRVAAIGATVYVLGGSAALSPSIDAALTALGYKPVRVAGTDRYATAVAVAGQLGNPTTVFEATGLNFPDALSGGPAAILSSAAVLLTNGATQAPETAAYLAAHTGDVRYALGGPAVAADSAAIALAGADRYATSAAIAQKFFPTATAIGLATAVNFPDALGAGPDLAAKKAPLLLVPPAPPLSGAYAPYLYASGEGTTSGTVFGGPSAIDDAIVTQLQDVLFAVGAR
jgi:putative cell wall-binding protein